MKLTHGVFDGQQGKKLNIAPRLALHLVACYPSRFTLMIVTPRQLREEIANMSPFKRPEEVKALSNGTHILTVVATKTITSAKYSNEQEELMCVEDATGEVTRVWVSHTSKAVDEALSVGIMTLLPDETVEVVIGAKFQVVVVNGKKVALLKVTPPAAPPA